MKKRTTQSKGFTLVEIMVATSIFMIIMLMAMGALITTTDAAKKAKALRVAMDNVNFAMESMTRSLRMGKDYSCTNTALSFGDGVANEDCVEHGGGGIVFTPAVLDGVAAPHSVGYAQVSRGDGTNTLKYCVGSLSCLDLVASNVDIEKLLFFVKGSAIDDTIQPSVYIIMKGSVLVKGEKTPFVVQTVTSQRNSE